MAWRTEKMCSDCPFMKKGAGLRLRKTLRPGRWREIILSLRMDQPFHCHKTTKTDEEGELMNPETALLCAGAIDWQIEHNGQPSQLARMLERIYP